MATKLFLRDSASDLTIGAATNKGLLLQQGAAKVASDATATVAGPTAGVQVKKSSVLLTWFSNPLKAVTISGTVTFNLWGLESASTANAGFDVLVERCDQAGNVISTIARSERGTELGTVAAVNNWTTTPTSTALAEGARVKVTVFANDAGGTMTASGRSFTLDYGAGTGVDGDSYVQLNETITEGAVAAETSPGTDAANVSTALSLAETGAGADEATLAAAILLSETGAGTDAANVVDNGSQDQDLETGDSGAGSDTAAASANVPLAEAAPGSDSVAASANATLAEAAPGSDQLALQASATATESGAGQQLASVAAETSSTESAPGTDQLALQAAIAATESGAGVDVVSASAEIVLGEGAPGLDAANAATAPEEGNPTLSETGPGADQLAIAVEIPLGETAPGSDAVFVTVSIAVNEGAPGSDGAEQADPPPTETDEITVSETGAGQDDVAIDLTINEGAPGRDRCFATWSSPFFGKRRRRPEN